MNTFQFYGLRRALQHTGETEIHQKEVSESDNELVVKFPDYGKNL